MKILMVAGIVLVLLGVVGFAVPYFSTTQTTDVASLGDLKLQTKESTWHSIPPLAAGAVLLVGVCLLGAAQLKRG